MHHPRAEDFQPSRLRADPAPRAAAEKAAHVHLRRGLGERKEARAEADRRAGAEHLPGEELERALEVSHGDVPVHGEAFHLVEHRRVGDVGVAAVHLAGADDPDRRRLRLHGADLDGRRVRAEQDVLGQVKRVLHVPGRVIPGDVERLEVVEVRLHFRPLGDGEAQAQKDLDDLVLDEGEWVQGSHRRAPAREREVHPLRFELVATLGRFELGQAPAEEGLDLGLGLVGLAPLLGALGDGDRRERAEELGEDALPAQVLHADLLEVGARLRPGRLAAGLLQDLADALIGHPGPSRLRPAWRTPPGSVLPARPGSSGRG